jgi:hypothetical protein
LRENPNQHQFVFVTARVAEFRANSHVQKNQGVVMNSRVDENSSQILLRAAINKGIERLYFETFDANSQVATLLDDLWKPVTLNRSVDAGGVLTLFGMEKHQRL